MTVSSDSLARAGINCVQAVALASDLNGTASADRLTRSGFPYPAAVEIARQKNAGSGDVGKLVAVGIPPAAAAIIKTGADGQ